jgi:predicted dehydrogenase
MSIHCAALCPGIAAKVGDRVNVAIIGCGLIGQKRARALANANLVACADTVKERAEALARTWPGALPETDWRKVAERSDVDAVIISTTNNMLAEITLAMISAGKHVLVEKPAARRSLELEPVIQAARKMQKIVRVGFNHRYHRAILKARELFESGALGELMFIRGRYGHGGRIGYEKEWRADPELSGGGELIDQGVHLIDLARWFMGDLASAQGFAHTYYWNMPVDDNGFMLLKTQKQQVAFLHVSCTEWKNTFSFEIFGHDSKLDISGLGGSYGVERLTYYRMLPQMGPPETTVWEYPMQDNSWEVEFAEFLEDIRLHRQPAANLDDAQAALRIVEHLYEVSRQ